MFTAIVNIDLGYLSIMMTILGGLWGLDAKLKLFHKVKVKDLLALSSKDWDRFSLT